MIDLLSFLFLSETLYTASEILHAYKPSREEAREVIIVEFDPKAPAPYMKTTINEIPKGVIKRGNMWIPGETPAWSPAHLYGLILALLLEYGSEKVYKALGN